MDVHPPSPTKARQREQITQAFRKRELGFRTVNISKEALLLNQPLKQPRPLYLTGEDVPVKMRSLSETTIGIVDPLPLYLYKKNAATSALAANTKQPDQLSAKCLPNLKALREKMREQSEWINWEIYSPATSGHLEANGHYKLPKAKSKIKPCLWHSELVMEGYDKSQIVCYVVNQDDPRSITDILTDKCNLEKSLNLQPLPFVFYSQQKGSIQIYFEDELATSFEDIATSESLLTSFANALTINPYHLQSTLSLLPWSDKLHSLASLSEFFTALPEGTPTSRDLLQLATHPANDNVDKLREYVHRGAQVNGRFLYGSGYHSLPYIVIVAEWARNIDPDEKRIENVVALLEELIRYSIEIDHREFDVLISLDDPFIQRFTDHLVAAGYRFPERCDYHLFCAYPTGAGTTVAFNNLFQSMPTLFMQGHLERLLIDHCRMNWSLPEDFDQHLMMLFKYGANPIPLRGAIISAAREGLESKIVGTHFFDKSGNRSPEEYADYLITLWQQRDTNPLFTNWPSKVAQATTHIKALREKLTPYPLQTNCRQVNIEEQMERLATAFKKPLLLARADNDEETVLHILEHYYRRPGPERLQWALQNDHPDVWKPLHSCSHALRTRNNVLWYMDLLEEFKLAEFSGNERALLALAAIYHDAAAEDVDKRDEERQSADYFRCDLARHFPKDLVEAVGNALEQKENDIRSADEPGLNERLRTYLRVLRFGDRMDFIRCSTVGADFPNWNPQQRHSSQFNTNLLDLPPEASKHFSNEPNKKTPFQCALEACMHGAVDLASATGDVQKDARRRGSYNSRFELSPNKKRLQRAFDQSTRPVTRLERMLDDNVRRYIADCAGIKTCHPEGHRTCRADTEAGIYHGIHNSWHDLQQVRVPECMSRVEKMLCMHDISQLSTATRQKIESEITRLRKEGIAMSLGTLTQQTLQSKAAQQVLKKRGVDVVAEQRQRGYNPDGTPCYETILAPQTNGVRQRVTI